MIKLHVDEKAFEEKPSGKEIGGIKKRLQGKSAPLRMSIEALTRKIGTGHSISPAVMRGTAAADWQEQQLFMVDIDNEREDISNLTPKQALAVCAEFGVPPVFYYCTFSYTKEKPKFRLAFLMDEVIKEDYRRQIIMDTLISLFPQSDKACANADRIFYGTDKTVKFCDENARISFEDILRLYTPPTPPPTSAKSIQTGSSDDNLEELKRNFDLLRYMEERNGQCHSSAKWVIFKNCEICGHKDDLAYNRDTNSWYCFSSNGGVGGSVIDYLMYAEDLTVRQAIDKFKYELCGLKRPADIWTQPIPFEEIRLPAFPVNCLPEPFGDWVEAIATNTETAVDMAAVCALALLSSAVQGKFEIKGKEGYYEPLNLYFLIIARSGERKSAIVRMMTKAVHLYEEKENLNRQPEIAKQEAQLSVLDNDIRRAEKKGDVKLSHKLRVQLQELKQNLVRPLRFIADDVTPEALTTMLANNDGVLTILSTEGGLFDIMAGKYSQTVSIDTLLKAHSGDPIRVDRKGRESETIEHPSLCMLISAQENVLNGLLNNEIFNGRGLTARILYCKPMSRIGMCQFETAEVPTDLSGRCNEILWKLLNIPYPENVPELLKLEPNASAVFERFFNWVEPRLVGELENTEGWGGKIVGQTLRIAGCMHCAKHSSNPAETLVSEKTMRQAVKISKYFIEHAKYAFSLMGKDKALHGAQYILKRLKLHHRQEISKYQIFRLCRSKHFSKADDILPALELLIEYGYIKEHIDPAPTGGRPKGSIYILNPLYFENMSA